MDPDQTAPTGAVCYGSTLFIYGASNSLVDNKHIERPANRDWACQKERCHTLSNKTSQSKSGVIAYERFTRATN